MRESRSQSRGKILHTLRGFWRTSWIAVCCLISCICLWSSCNSAATEVPKLVAQLKSKQSGERNRAALKLGSYGKDAKAAVNALVERLSDENNGVRTSAAYALRQIDTPEAQRALDQYRK